MAAAEELWSRMEKVASNNLPNLVAALRLFESNAEFIVPRDQGDLIRNQDRLLSQVNSARSVLGFALRDGIGGIEETKIDLSLLARARYVCRDTVGGVLPYKGEVEIYELTSGGRELFLKLFTDTTPKMCGKTHWAKPG